MSKTGDILSCHNWSDILHRYQWCFWESCNAQYSILLIQPKMSMVVVSCDGIEEAQNKVHTWMNKSSTFVGKSLIFIESHFNLHQTQITSQMK